MEVLRLSCAFKMVPDILRLQPAEFFQAKTIREVAIREKKGKWEMLQKITNNKWNRERHTLSNDWHLYPLSCILLHCHLHQFKLSPNKNTSEHALHIHTCTLHCSHISWQRREEIKTGYTHTQSAGGERCWRAKSSSPKPSFLTNSQSRSQQSVKWCRF